MANAHNGNVVLAGDDVTVLGSVTAISGSGQSASVTVKDRSGLSFVVPAGDCSAPQSVGVAISRNGKPFGVGSDVTIPAVILSVVESGQTSQAVAKTYSSLVTAGSPAPAGSLVASPTVTIVHTTISAASPKKH